MPIEYQIDFERRLVIAKGVGTVADPDIFDYQKQVWSRPEVLGFNELVDMSAVIKIDPPSAERVQQLAALSVKMDAGAPASKFAIVAPDHLAFGLGRMYEIYRSLEAGSKKKVGVFRTLPEALAFLGVDLSPESLS